MKTYGKTLLAAIAFSVAVTGSAEATLTTIGQASYNGSSYNLIYDNDSPFGSVVYFDYSHASDLWANQVAWARSLNSTGILNYALNPGVSITWGGDWRLPNALDDGTNIYGYDGSTTAGSNIVSSEMGHLYYTDLGNKGYIDTNGSFQQGYGLKNSGPFMNLMSLWYWTGTEYGGNPNDELLFGAHIGEVGTGYNAWSFSNYDGTQILGYMGSNDGTELGLAVRSGKVSVDAPIPEPATILLFGGGLLMLTCWRFRQHATDKIIGSQPLQRG